MIRAFTKVENPAPLLNCEICNQFPTRSKAELLSHKRTHEAEDAFRCDECDFKVDVFR